MKVVVTLDLKGDVHNKSAVLDAIHELIQDHLDQKLEEIGLKKDGVTLDKVLSVDEFEDHVEVVAMKDEIEGLQAEVNALCDHVYILEDRLEDLEDELY